MYNHSPIAVPAAATGISLVATGEPTWLTMMFAFCAVFAIIGAVFAVKRTLPVPNFVRCFRSKRQDKLLKKQLECRNY